MPAASDTRAEHVPVLLGSILSAISPVSGHWVDGTLGAGGYTRALFEAGAERVSGIDQDPLAIEMAQTWAAAYGEKFTAIHANFAQMDEVVESADGVVLDLGVSSMQLDRAERGFSFMKDGPLDMRMSQEGPSAADIVATFEEGDLANLIYIFGEERASRRIARAIVKARAEVPITRTLQLANIIEGVLPHAKPGQSHPATRTFQAFRIAVNGEYRALFDGLLASERCLVDGGTLAVVTFHSVEDRMVKRFLQARSGGGGTGSRHAPERQLDPATFRLKSRKAIAPTADEIHVNPRARSAKLRIAQRTAAHPQPLSPKAVGMPEFERT
ncbi:MAG: 16S rRNA (cytosine(1402)-N(4))-methyltransferase RsmH [Pseudomonadota bacterium]